MFRSWLGIVKMVGPVTFRLQLCVVMAVSLPTSLWGTASFGVRVHPKEKIQFKFCLVGFQAVKTSVHFDVPRTKKSLFDGFSFHPDMQNAAVREYAPRSCHPNLRRSWVHHGLVFGSMGERLTEISPCDTCCVFAESKVRATVGSSFFFFLKKYVPGNE